MPHYPWGACTWFPGKPNVGQLMDLCEENYRYLMRLAPDLRQMQGCCQSQLKGALDLYLEVLEQTPYTTLIHITYFFSHRQGHRPDPDARVRIYHDARQSEVVELRQQALPLNAGVERPTLEQKWRINLFLSKWLAYCVRQGHQFNFDESQVGGQSTRRPDLAESC